MKNLRVVLADGQSLVRAGIRALLERLRGVQVVGEASNGADALRLVARLQPDVVLLDVSMAGLNGVETARRATAQHPRTRVLMVSMHADKEYVRRAFVAGASGYLLKEADPSELEMAVRAVARGEVWLSPALSRAVVDNLVEGSAKSRADPLTSRQREVLQLIAEGHSTKQIASRLHISTKTVEAHRAQIMGRLDIRHTAGLVHYAIRVGIVST
jgi:DNA-binding NarL/FixJ family response regulator